MLQEYPSEANPQPAQQEGATTASPVDAAGAIIETGAQKKLDAQLADAEQLSRQSPLVQELSRIRYDGGHTQDAFNGAIALAQRMDSHRDHVPFALTTDCAMARNILSSLGLPPLDDPRILSTMLDNTLPQALAAKIDRSMIFGMIQILNTEQFQLSQLQHGMELLIKMLKDKREFAYEKGLIDVMSREGKLTLAINVESELRNLLERIRDLVVARETQQPVTTT